jgi:DHA1 family multidrug resistance protein-like MFS transporter
LRKDVIFLGIAVFLLVLGTYVAGTILAPYAESLGATSIWVALITSGLYIVRLFTGVPIGKLADRKGSLAILNYSLILYLFIAIAYWMAFNPWTLLGARLLHGLASAMMLPMAMAYIGGASPVNQEGYYMGFYNMIVLIASGIGPQIATVITAYRGLKSTFVVLFILALIALLLLWLLRNSTHHDIMPAGITEKAKADWVWKSPGLIALSSVNIAMAIILSLMGFFFIKFPLSRGINIVSVGSLLALYNLLTGLAQIPFGKLFDRWNKSLFIILAGISVSLLLFAFPLCNSLWMMFLLIAILGFLSAVVLAASSALSAVVGRTIGMNSTMGFLGTASSVGMVLGCTVLSIIPSRFGIDFIFYISGGIVIIGVLIFVLLWDKSYRLQKKENSYFRI